MMMMMMMMMIDDDDDDDDDDNDDDGDDDGDGDDDDNDDGDDNGDRGMRYKDNMEYFSKYERCIRFALAISPLARMLALSVTTHNNNNETAFASIK